MKFIKLLLPAILLFAFVCTTEAQIVVTSTSASTEKTPKTKSIRQKGLVVRPEIGIGYIGQRVTLSSAVNALCNVTYQFNPYISLGGGSGIYFNKKNYTPSLNYLSIPLYANIRGYFCNLKISPYYDVKLGYNISLLSYSYYWGSDYYYRDRLNGFYGNFSLGLQHKNYDFGIEFNLFERIFNNIGNNIGNSTIRSFNSTIRSFDSFTLCLKFAYNFQIKKKK